MEHLEGEQFRPQGYHCYFHDAEKKGYSGVGIYCLREPKQISIGLGWPIADQEGRYIQADFGNLSVASLYCLLVPVVQNGKHINMNLWRIT